MLAFKSGDPRSSLFACLHYGNPIERDNKGVIRRIEQNRLIAG